MTTSSSAVLPARSPRPLMVHSTCVAPLRTASMASAVAMPRSLWVCTEMVTSSMPSTRSRRSGDARAEGPRQVVAGGVRDVHHRGARLHGRLDDPHEEVLVGAAGVLGIETRRRPRSCGRASPRGRPRSMASSSVRCSLSRRWLGLTPRPVWMRGRLAVRSASAATSMSLSTARVRPQTVQGVAGDAADLLDALEVARARDGEACLDDIDVHADELPRDDELLLGVHACAGRLLAVSERGVEDVDLAGHGSSCGRCRADGVAGGVSHMFAG